MASERQRKAAQKAGRQSGINRRRRAEEKRAREAPSGAMFGFDIEVREGRYVVGQVAGGGPLIPILFEQPKADAVRAYTAGGSSMFGLEWMKEAEQLGIWHPTDNYGSGGLFPLDGPRYPTIVENFADDREVEEEERSFREALAHGDFDDWPELTGEAV